MGSEAVLGGFGGFSASSRAVREALLLDFGFSEGFGGLHGVRRGSRTFQEVSEDFLRVHRCFLGFWKSQVRNRRSDGNSGSPG